MDQRDLLNRSLDAGREVTQKTQDRIEALVRELAKAAEEQAGQAQQLVQEVVERSRATTEQVIDVVDRELRSQANALGLATRADIDRLEARIEALELGLAEERPPKKKAGAKKAGAKKAEAKKAGPKKAGPKKAAGTTEALPARAATATARRPVRKAAPRADGAS
jgi:polyhydroxyalkanoate synthesis regulator phasin